MSAPRCATCPGASTEEVDEKPGKFRCPECGKEYDSMGRSANFPVPLKKVGSRTHVRHPKVMRPPEHYYPA